MVAFDEKAFVNLQENVSLACNIGLEYLFISRRHLLESGRKSLLVDQADELEVVEKEGEMQIEEIFEHCADKVFEGSMRLVL